MRVVVTGGSGKGGTWVVRDLRDHGHDVLNVDTRNDGSRKDVRLYYVRSSDGGATWGDETQVATALPPITAY